MGSQLAADDPERLGGYWIASRLGAGGQGVVYEAYESRGTRVALKVLHRGATPFERERFGREADAARRVASFCTARVVDVGADGDTPYIVSEYVDGHSLAAEVGANGPLEADAVLRLAAGAATALATIHQAGVIHRDLKPGNILLGPDGPRIIDFGIARAPDMSLTATGALQGTLGYMAPEVLSGQRATAASDIFAWAAVVIFAASGTEPFRGSNIGEVAYRTAALEPDLSAIPDRIRQLLTAALSKAPEQRPDAAGLLTGLIGGTPKAVDPRLALLEAGARWAAAHVPSAETTEVVPPLGDRAEAVFTELPPAGQRAARQVLLRMVVPGEAADGSQDSVRSASRDEIYAGQTAQEASTIREVVDELVAAGILVTDGDSVRPVSAALLPAWRRLHEWVETDRASLTVLRRVGTAARFWSSHGERRDDLLSGTALRTCLEWLATAPTQLRPTPLERRFLQAARTEANRAAKRRRRLLTSAAGALAIALIAGVIAWFQTSEARDRANQATAKSVAQAADSLRVTQPETAMLLSLASWRIARTSESRAALNSAATQLQSSAIDLPDDEVLASLGGGWQLSSDGTQLSVAGDSGAGLWDLRGGSRGVTKPLYELPWNGTEARPVISPDGRMIVEQDEDGTYRRISAGTGRTVGEQGVESGEFSLTEVTNTGIVLLDHAGEEEGKASVVDFEGKLLVDRAESDVIGLSPDGRYYAVCATEGIEIRSLGSDEGPVLSAEDTHTGLDSEGRCPRVVFSPDGRFVAVWELDTTEIWDLTAGRSTGRVQMQAEPEEYESIDSLLRFSSDGRYLLVYEDGDLTVSLSEGTEDEWKPEIVHITVPTTSIGQSDVQQIALDERTKTLSYISTSTNQLQQSDVSAFLDLGPDLPGIEGVAISPDGGTALIRKGTGETSTQHLMDLLTGKTRGGPLPQQTSPMEKAVFVGALSSEGRFIAYNNVGPAASPLDVVVKNASTGTQVDRVPNPEGHVVEHLSLSPDGRYLSVSLLEVGLSDRREVQVRDVRKHKKIAEYKGQEGHGVFSPDSGLHVSPQGDVLDLATGDTRTSDFGHGSTTELAFSPDGTRLAVLKSDGWVEVWDGEVRERKGRMPGATVQGESHFGATAKHLAFSEDGSLLAASVDDQAVQLWDVDERLALGQPLALTGQHIDTMAFDGEVLRSLSGDKVHTLDLDPKRLADRVCKRVGRELTRKEWQTFVPDAEYRKVC